MSGHAHDKRLTIAEMRDLVASMPPPRKPVAFLVNGDTYKQLKVSVESRMSLSAITKFSGYPVHVCHSQEHAKELYDALVRAGYEVHCCHPLRLVTMADEGDDEPDMSVIHHEGMA